MAERRMFAKSIIDSDAFLDMSPMARLLYYDLSMRADDDGFIGSPKKIMRIVGATEEDLSELVRYDLVYWFNTGIVVIRHWLINNRLRRDTYNETIYTEEKAKLTLERNGLYHIRNEYVTDLSRTRHEPVTNPLRTRYEPVTQLSIVKYSTGKFSTDKLSVVKEEKESKKKEAVEIESETEERKVASAEAPTLSPPQAQKKFVKPRIEQIKAYCDERRNDVDAQRFYDFYEAKGWMVGKNHMKDWKAAVRTWELRDNESSSTAPKIDRLSGKPIDPQYLNDKWEVATLEASDGKH